MQQKSPVEIMSNMADVCMRQGDLRGAIDYLIVCIKELDKQNRGKPTAPESSAEFFDRFNLHPKSGC